MGAKLRILSQCHEFHKNQRNQLSEVKQRLIFHSIENQAHNGQNEKFNQFL